MGVADFTGQPAVFIPNKWPISPKYPTTNGWTAFNLFFGQIDADIFYIFIYCA
jgi:hypothetical protein